MMMPPAVLSSRISAWAPGDQTCSTIEMFELAATPQRRFKGLTLLVDRDGMELTCGNLIVLGVDLLAMHVGNRNDIDQCCNGAAVASATRLAHAKLHRVPN